MPAGRSLLTMLVVLPALGLLGGAARPSVERTAPPEGPGHPASVPAGGCDILILWYTYRTEMEYDAAQVRVRGAPQWSYVRGARIDRLGITLGPPPPTTKTNGVVWNWKAELKQERCDLNRRYRFRIRGLDETVTGRSNELYDDTERWIYFPSKDGWTKKTTIDLGYVDLCLMDGTKCDGPYYPSGNRTPIL